VSILQGFGCPKSAAEGVKKLQIPPLRFATVGMTILTLVRDLTVCLADRVNHALVHFAAYLCHPDRTRISYYAAPEMATCAAFIEESRMSSLTPPSSTGNPGQWRDLQFLCPNQEFLYLKQILCLIK
jgi:hypothetical protein